MIGASLSRVALVPSILKVMMIVRTENAIGAQGGTFAAMALEIASDGQVGHRSRTECAH